MRKATDISEAPYKLLPRLNFHYFNLTQGICRGTFSAQHILHVSDELFKLRILLETKRTNPSYDRALGAQQQVLL